MRYPLLSTLACLLLTFSAVPICAQTVSAGPVLTEPDKVLRSDEELCRITIRYPVTGIAVVDRENEEWGRQQLEAFRLVCAEDKPEQAYAFDASCTLVRASDRFLTSVWDVFDYTGGAHANEDIQTRIFDLQKGKPVELYDLFENLDDALKIFSDYSVSELSRKLGEEGLVPDMLREGTAPEADNFSRIALTSEGLRLYFPPYQVAPWAAGLQTVDIPHRVLEKARPVQGIWK